MTAEFGILYFLQDLRSPALDRFFAAYSSLGNAGAIWILLTAAALLVPRWRRCGTAMALALILDFVLCNLGLKTLFARERPCWLDPAVELLIRAPGDYSFPSGHTAAAFAAAGAVWRYHRRAGAAALILAALMGFSRLYLFVHFPTDVLGGAALGLLCAWLAAEAERRLSGTAPERE